MEDDEDTSVLIPWLDLLNHSSNRPTASARWVPQASVYEVQARCKREAGEAVFLSYGALTNELLLARYGFVDPAHATDVAALPAPVSSLLPPRGAGASCARVRGRSRRSRGATWTHIQGVRGRSTAVDIAR